MKANEPGMKIENQVDAGLRDLRETLRSLANFALTPDISDRVIAEQKAKYQLELIVDMIHNHRFGGLSQPWSTLKPMVEEEFNG